MSNVLQYKFSYWTLSQHYNQLAIENVMSHVQQLDNQQGKRTLLGHGDFKYGVSPVVRTQKQQTFYHTLLVQET